MAAAVTARADARGWPITRAPKPLIAVIAASVVVAIAWSTLEVHRFVFSAHSMVTAVILAVSAVAFEELAAGPARLQIRLSSALKRDMLAVWAVAGTVALPPVETLGVVVIVLTFTWFRQQRPAGESLHRKCFNSANCVISCLVAGFASSELETAGRGLPAVALSPIVILAVVAVYAASNRLLASCALLILGVAPRELLGTRDENLTELATLCLGGLVGVTAMHVPILAVLVLAPMVTLQRGAVVRELETAATTDAKTGLLNAVAWEEVARRELVRGAREGAEVAILIIDVDHFKGVNDRFGHLAGDRVLSLIGRTLAAGVREYDCVARFGGEEFVAVLPSTPTSDALDIAERLRSRVNDLRISQVVDDLDAAMDEVVAVSIGVAVAPMVGVELPDLLHEADAALYRAKSGGRNQVVVADDGRANELYPSVFS